jgi:uncharacterized membrane protein YphA (DoxX/SURF4 family)
MSVRPTAWRLSRPLLRVALGAVFVGYGWLKLADPYSFLKAIHEYGVLGNAALLDLRLENLAAAGLPLLEILGGLLLATGIWRRGAAAWLALFLALFTIAIAWKVTDPALAATQPNYFLREFDCGCGTGVVIVWEKLTMNLVLLVALILLGLRNDPPPRADAT